MIEVRASAVPDLRGKALAALGLSLALSTPLHAARPMATDDARTVEAGGCQVESFTRRDRRRDEHEFWLLPACNPWGAAELTLGGQRIDALASSQSNLILQAKRTLLSLEEHATGVAVAIGTQRQRPADAAAAWAPYLYVATSQSVADGAAVLHANLGSARDPSARRTRATWGLGTELAVDARVQIIAEAYGQAGEAPSRQAGVRWWLLPGRLQIDGTLGARDGAAPRRWASLGVRALF